MSEPLTPGHLLELQKMLDGGVFQPFAHNLVSRLLEENKNDYKDMRRFQRQFIEKDHQARDLERQRDQAAEAMQRVRDLHRNENGLCVVCMDGEGSQADHPCDTIKALEAK